MFEYLHEIIVEQAVEYEHIENKDSIGYLQVSHVKRDDVNACLESRAKQGWRLISFQTFAFSGEISHRATWERNKEMP